MLTKYQVLSLSSFSNLVHCMYVDKMFRASSRPLSARLQAETWQGEETKLTQVKVGCVGVGVDSANEEQAQEIGRISCNNCPSCLNDHSASMQHLGLSEGSAKSQLLGPSPATLQPSAASPGSGRLW